MTEAIARRHPPWLKVRAPGGPAFAETRATVRSLGLHTVCEEAHCPNVGECWGHKTATFMLLGDTCTRNCSFCAVKHGRPLAVDPEEPGRVAVAVVRLGLRHVVVTSVDRDDLPDGGAGHFAATARAIKEASPACRVETLVPDFKGTVAAVDLAYILHNSTRLTSRVDRDVGLRTFAAPDVLADEEHRRLVALALADDDPTGERDLVHRAAHRLDRRGVRLRGVAVAHPMRRGDRARLGDADQFQNVRRRR